MTTSGATSPDTARKIHVSAVAFIENEPSPVVLTVRKRQTTLFQFPGGKPEPGESALIAAIREVAEETGLVLSPSDVRSLGSFEAEAANESGHNVVAEVFLARQWSGEPQARAEIAEMHWAPLELGDHAENYPLAPLMAEVFPVLSAIMSSASLPDQV